MVTQFGTGSHTSYISKISTNTYNVRALMCLVQVLLISQYFGITFNDCFAVIDMI